MPINLAVSLNVIICVRIYNTLTRVWDTGKSGVLHVAIPCSHHNLEIIKGNEKETLSLLLKKHPLSQDIFFCGPQSTKDVHKRLNE